jgi:parvulin-like peptidyl-prolyl cis-trans isomerase-like protein
MRSAVIATLVSLVVAGAAPASSRSAPLPDSVLAALDDGRQVTVSGFAHAWRQMRPPIRSDSLTPEGARKFLDLLVDKEVLGAAAMRERWTWTDREQAEYDALRDRLVMQAMLDSVTEATRLALARGGDIVRGLDTLGIVARDSAVARLGLTFDDALCERLARVWQALPRPSHDSSMFAQIRVLGTMPAVSPSDTGRVVGRSLAGEFRVSDLLASWSRLNPLYRPRIDGVEQMRDVVRNGVFERMLRAEAERRRVLEWPDIARQLANQRELNNVTHYVEREVGTRVPMDSLTLLAYYRAHQAMWVLPLRVKVAQLMLPDRASATRMALDLRDPARAESLVARARHGGVDWTTDVSEKTDRALFERALAAGVGTVFGPDSMAGGWSVTRVMAVLPGRSRPFHEVSMLVEQAWGTEGSEKRMRQVLADLRGRSHVRTNEPALAQMVQNPPPALAGRR